MAYIVQSTLSYTDGVTAASFTPGRWITETQLTNDYVLVWAVNDGGASAISIGAGWTEIYRSTASIAGVRCGLWYAKNTGSTLTAPTVSGANDDWAVTAILIRDADASTLLDVAVGVTEQTAFVTKYTAPSVTTTNGNSLVLRLAGLDLAAYSTPAQGLGGYVDVARRMEVAIETYICQQQKIAAGATGTFTWDRSASRGGVLLTVALRNKSGGAVGPHSANFVTVVEEFVLAADSPSPASIHTRQATIAGVSTLTPSSGPTASSLTDYTTDLAWYGGYSRWTTTSPASLGVVGGVCAVTANWSAGKLFGITLNGEQAAALSVDGSLFYFEDNAGNWRSWRPVNRLDFGSFTFKTITADLPNETFADSSGTIDWANIRYFGLLVQQTTATGASRLFNFRALWSIGTLAIAGGGAVRPVTALDISSILNSGAGIYRGFLQGSGQVLSSVPLQIGNGTDNTFFKLSAQSLELQRNGNPATPWFRLGEQKQPVTIYTSATDTIDLSSAILATVTTQPLTIHASSNTGASIITAGVSLIGWDVTWKTGFNCVGASFSRCGEIAAKGAQFNDCTISGTISTDAAIAFDANSSMNGTTIDVTGTAAAYHLELGTAVTAFTLTDVTFNGTPGTDKVHVKATTGTVTISLSGSTSLTSGEVTSDGATVSIVSGAILTVQGLVAGSRVKIVRTDTSAVLENQLVAGTSQNFSLTYTGEVRVEARNASGSPAYKPWFTIVTVGTGQTVTALQEID